MSGFLQAGFATVAQLKGRITPASMATYDTDTEWDTDLIEIGIAVAEEFNSLCNRLFQRGAGAVYETTGGGSSFALDRYPVESVTSLVKTGKGTSETLTSQIYQLHGKTGIVEMDGQVGWHKDKVAITYDGGYWLNDGGALPSGATELPTEILNAWVMQCQAQVTHLGTLYEAGVTNDEAKITLLRELELLPAVRAILAPYKRFTGI